MSNDPPDTVEDEQREVRDMVVQAYYISTDSDGRPGMPALRMKMLSSVGGAPDFIDQEILRGVEDLQIQFGVDPGDDLDGDGAPDDPGGDGMADFVNGYRGAVRERRRCDPGFGAGRVRAHLGARAR